MGQQLNDDVLRVIFGHLNGYDLHIASRVCRTWFEVATELNRTIGPMCIIKDNSNISFADNVEVVRKEIIQCCPVMPSLHMFFTLLGWRKEIPKSCYCQYLPLNCYSVSIENFWSMEEDNIVLSMFLPEISDLKVTTITFNRHASGKEIYCEELKCSFDLSFSNADQLKTIFRPVFNNDLFTKNCLILLYKCNTYPLPENLILSLEDWFPNKKVSIFGGMVQNLSICNSMHNSGVCKINADCISLIIRGRDMQTWTLKFNGFYDGYKLMREFRDKIVLKTHSIGFMIAGECCLKYCYNRESFNFKKLFPRVPIFQIYGFETIEATSSNGLFTKFYNKWDRMESFVFMVITYN